MHPTSPAEPQKITGVPPVLRQVLRERRPSPTEPWEGACTAASHELRTPVTAILLCAYLLLAGDAGALAPPQRNFVERMHRNVLQLQRVVTKLSAVAA